MYLENAIEQQIFTAIYTCRLKISIIEASYITANHGLMLIFALNPHQTTLQ